MGKGLSPNDPPTEDGKQTKIDFAFDLMCPQAMLALARVLQEGREKGRTQEGWKSIPTADHLNHALMHIFAHQAGDRQEDHLQHAFCRMMMAWSVENTLPAKDIPQFRDVYLCYPYKDDPGGRTEKILMWAQDNWQPGIHFYIPHLMMQYLPESDQTRKMIIERCKSTIARCGEVWVVGDAISEGMAEEVAFAREHNIPVIMVEE